MPNLATTLKQEITRLARKEAKSQTDSLREANAQYRRDIAELKRQAAELKRQVAYLATQEKKRVEAGPAEVNTENRRFSAKRLARHREKLGLSAADYGRLVGVTAQTIYNWEQERSRPGAEQMAAVVEIRGIGKREAGRRLELLAG